MATKRKRKTREEKLAEYRAHVARLEAALAGEPDTSTEDGILKSLRRRLRKTNTELKAARMQINGVRREDGNGFLRSSIDDKIAQTEKRLASQRETKARAEEFLARLPFDIERLQALCEAAEQGEEVEFPADLTPLSDEENRTDEEHETTYIAKGEDGDD